MVRNVTGFITMLWLACMIYALSTPAHAQIINTNQGADIIFQHYTHPVRGFALSYPSDAFLEERDAPVDISINSRTGWGMTVQSSAANPQVSLDDLAARLEAHYLGKQKSWSQKISGSHRVFKTFNAYDASYEGSGMRVRVVIIRTPVYDFVLMFVTPIKKYISAEPVINSILNSFEPVAQSIDQAQSDDQAYGDTPDTQLQTRYLNIHEEPLGYSIKYPESWRVGKPDDFTLVFAGPKKGPAANVAITIQNVSSPVEASSERMAQAVLQQLRTQMAYGIPNVRHVGGGSVVVDGITGFQLVSDYNRVSTPYRQWTIVLSHPSGSVVHIWTYTAPLDLFDEFRDITETMINSWRMEIVTQ